MNLNVLHKVSISNCLKNGNRNYSTTVDNYKKLTGKGIWVNIETFSIQTILLLNKRKKREKTCNYRKLSKVH